MSVSLPLRHGGRYQCAECHKLFANHRAFTEHRRGPYWPPGLCRCLHETQMLAKGMRRDGEGYWLTVNASIEEQRCKGPPGATPGSRDGDLPPAA